MAKSRKDNKGRVLRKGETQRSCDGKYVYTYTDPEGKRRSIYSKDIMELREREEKLIKDQLDGLDTYVAGSATVNFVFDRYISTKSELRGTTMRNYRYMYDRFIRNGFGKKKIATIKFSDVLQFYQHLLKEKEMQMTYTATSATKATKIIFPVAVTIISSLVAPDSASLVGMLMFGNLIRVCGVLDSLSSAAQNILTPLISLLLGLSMAPLMKGELILRKETLMIMAFGLLAFVLGTITGVMFLKIVNVFLPKEKRVNPLIGGAGLSAFPMSSRVVEKIGIQYNKQNHLLPFALGANVAGQIGSVLAGGIILSLIG